MTQSTKLFTQSLRLLDPVNQKRIQLKQRILWPDYQILHLLNTFSSNSSSSAINTQLDLNNLFMYCPFQDNFLIKKTNKLQYLHANQLYSDQFTHLAFYICKGNSLNQRNRLATGYSSNTPSLSIQNKRHKSLQKGYKIKQHPSLPQQIYIILSKRPIAIDQIVKTQHKVCISIAPLSQQKFLWGGTLHYQEFQSFQHNKQQPSGLFKSNGQSFGFKIQSKPSFVTNSYRKSNGLIDKRQQRYSNYFSNKKQEESKSILTQKERKQCSNRLKILPQHIRQHRQMLYILIDITNNSQLPQRADEYRFVSIDIYGRHLKPKYGGVYEKQSSSQQQDSNSEQNANNNKTTLGRYKRLLREQIFIVYSMQFMQFNSYLQSQLNYEQSQQLRQINFRGSCLMFSAMKNLQLKSNNNNEGNKKQKQSNFYGKSLQKCNKQRYTHNMDIQSQQEQNSKSLLIKQQQSAIASKYQTKQQTMMRKKRQINYYDKQSQHQHQPQIIQILPQLQGVPVKINIDSKQILYNKRRQVITSFIHVMNACLDKKQQDGEIFIPVFNPQGFQPLRIGVDKRLMKYLNPQIQKLTTKVSVQSHRIKQQQYQKQQQKQLSNKTNNKNNNINKRLSIYEGKKYRRGDNDNTIQRQKSLVSLDVFLTDKVYRQQTVYMLIQLLRRIQYLGQHQDIKQWRNKSQQQLQVSQQWKSIQQFKNLLTLLSDIKANNNSNTTQQQNRNNTTQQQNDNNVDSIRQVLCKQTLYRINIHLQQQLNHIKQVQSLTYKLINQSSSACNQSSSACNQSSSACNQSSSACNKSSSACNKSVQNNNDQIDKNIIINKLQQEQLQIIDRIRQYHNKYVLNSQQNLSVQLFFYLIIQDMNSNISIINQSYIISEDKHQQQQQNQHQQQNNIDQIQSILNNLLLINCKSLFQNNSYQLSYIINKLQSSSFTKTNSNHNNQPSSSSILMITQLLKNAITYVIQNLSTIPINIFLAQPLQQFNSSSTYQQHHHQQQQFVDNNQQKQLQTLKQYKRLRRFIKKHFIKGHNYLQRHDKHNTLDTDNHYINLIIDLLNKFIQISNIQIKFNNKNNQQKTSYQSIQNVIQLINYQYSQCLSANQYLMVKALNKQQSIVNMDKIQIEQQQVIINKLLDRQQQIIKNNHNNSEWKVNHLCYLINSYHKHTQAIQQSITQQKQQSITIKNKPNKLISLSQQQLYKQYNKYNYVLTISQSLNTSNQSNNFISSYISFQSALYQKDSQYYSLDVIKTHMGLNYHNNSQYIINDNKSLFICYQVFVEVQITTNKSITSNNPSNNNDIHNIILKGSNILMFQNFNYSHINKNIIQLHHIFNQKQQQKQTLQFAIPNIHKVDIKVYSKKLPILQASLSFVNLRLGKYLKNILKSSIHQNQHYQSSRRQTSHKKQINRKTIGGRFTEYLNNRKSTLSIQSNILHHNNNSQQQFIMRNLHIDNTKIHIDNTKIHIDNTKIHIDNTKNKQNNQLSTLFQLPQSLLLGLLRCDKSYIQDEQKILYFIDQFYEYNQPQYQDYILYLSLRPQYISLKTMLKHYFSNKLKYEDSNILNTIINSKLNTSSSLCNNKNSLHHTISQTIITKPRISSYKPLKNIINTIQQRQLLNQYMKQLTMKKSLNKNQHTYQQSSKSKINLFTNKQFMLQIKQQRKQNPNNKDVQI